MERARVAVVLTAVLLGQIIQPGPARANDPSSSPSPVRPTDAEGADDFSAAGEAPPPDATTQRSASRETESFVATDGADVYRVDGGYDLDQYLYRADSPLDLTISITDSYGPVTIDGSPVAGHQFYDQTAQLTLRIWDVDEAEGERDILYVGQTAIPGHLSGSNNQWTIQTFEVPANLLFFPAQQNPDGLNEFSIDIDTTQAGWAVQVDWAELRLGLPVTAPTSCADENLSAQVDPLTDGRVTVVYDPRYLVDPAASIDYLADAERIARRVQARAEEALDRYDVLLGSTEFTSHTPPNVTIEIRCQPRLEVLDEIPVFHIDRPGFTGDWDDVQLRSDAIRTDFAGAVTDPRDGNGDFRPGDWDSPPARWASLVDHEIFHAVQHWGQSDMGLDYLLGPDAANLEAGATLAQDLFADADDDAIPERGSYWRAVERYFQNPVPVTVEVPSDEDAYTGAPVLQYVGEQYGGLTEPDHEQRVANFLRRMIVSDRIRIDQLQDAMLSAFDTVDEALRDFAIAAYVNDRPGWADYPARYRMADEAHNHAGTGAGTDYPTFQGITGTDPSDDNELTLGGSLTLDEPIGEGEARVFEIDIAPNVLLARLSLTAWNATERKGAAVAILPVLADGTVEVSPAYMPHWMVRAEYQEPITVPVAGLSKLAVVVGSTAPVASGSGEAVYELSASDVSNLPRIDIVPPSDEPRSIGPGPDFNPLQVLVRPTTNGSGIRGLSAAAFDVEVGGLAAEIRSVVRVTPDGSYALLVQPPATLVVGAHDLKVTLANVTFDTAPGAIIVEEPAGFSALSSTAGLTGFLHLEAIGEVGTPVQVRYILADRAGPIIGATATATVTDPNGAQRSVPLADDGGHGDGGAGDGIYGAAVWSTDTIGVHTIVVSATGEDSSGTPFSLEASDSVSLDVKADSDGDGVADTIEPWYQLDPADGSDAAGDIDYDDLPMVQELAARTDPFVADSDGGGEADGSEIANGRDPLDAADDGAASTPRLSATLRDGALVEIRAATGDGSGSVRLTRMVGGTETPLGTHAGTGVVLSDGPLASGEYAYVAVAVGADGSESAPLIMGPVAPVADATPPDAYLVVNGGIWSTADTEVVVDFADLSEPVAEMRLALDREGLEQAAWVPYQASSTLSLPSDLGLYTVFAELRDAAGNQSRILSAVAEVVDATPPTSAAGPLDATYTTSTIDVPFTVSQDPSGISTVELWWRTRVSSAWSWSNWTRGPAGDTSPIRFSASTGGDYEFYTVAVDGRGNREPAATVADVGTELPDASVVWGWGETGLGRLGVGSVEACGSGDCANPVQMLGSFDGTAIAAGDSHSLALRADGSAWAWGAGSFGQLGDGKGSHSATPVRVALEGITGIAAGGNHSLALRADGSVWRWGYLYQTTVVTYSPVQVTGLPTVVDVAGGGSHSLALAADGTVWAWGYNSEGQLGNNSRERSATPVEVSLLDDVIAISAGFSHSLAVRSDGTVWAWGDGDLGQLGLGGTQDKRRPALVAGLPDIVAVAAGGNHSVALAADGSLWAWGSNVQGQLGDGTRTDRLEPVPVPGVAAVDAVAAGYGHTVALTATGSLLGWGDNASGQIDSGDFVDRTSPAPMATSLPPVTSVTAGSAHTLVTLGSSP